MKKIIFLFSGQGSQYRGMGQKLFEQNPVFKKSIQESEIVVKRLLNRSLVEELYNSKETKFNDLLITHPAIVAVEIAMYKVLKSINILPHYVCGNSLGEFAAAVVSGIWDTETAIEASIEQAKAIVRNDIEGGMLAVIGKERISLEKNYSRHGLFLAADNFKKHFTLSGPNKNLNAFQLELKVLGIQFFRLPVEAPFHSPLVLESINDFNYHMGSVLALKKPKLGFVSGIECKELNRLSDNYFGEIASSYTNYPKTIEYIEKKGSCFYIDLGPSGTSSTFVKYNLKDFSKSETFQIMTPYMREIEQLEKLKITLNLKP